MSKKQKRQAASGAHFEAEKGYPLSKSEYHTLKALLPGIGFAFQKKSFITDFVIPTHGETTRRMRVENIKTSIDGKTGVSFIRCFKSHPIKGPKGRDVRMESERNVKHRAAKNFVIREMDRLEAPVPYYSKKRWHFTGTWEGLEVTITLDRAHKLGKFSGHYMELETLLPIGTTKKDVAKALRKLAQLASHLIEKRRVKISYRKMLMQTSGVKDNKLPKVSNKKLAKAKVNYRKLLNKLAAA